MPKRGAGLGQFADLKWRGGLGKKVGVVVLRGGEGVHTPVHTMFSRIETSVGFLFGFSEKLQNVYLHFVFQS